MDSNGTFARPLDESLARELPQLQSLRIAPLRHPVSSRGLSVPSPLEPNASVVRDSNKAGSSSSSGGGAPGGSGSGSGCGPTTLPTVPEFPNNTTQTKKTDDPVLSLEPPPKPILPAFVNLRALEHFPYSSFDGDSHLVRKRRRLDIHTDGFGEHLQLPIPQQQKEHRPPPFGPFAILNGLNEPPPNAALLPPIEAGSITQLLSKPTKGESVVEPALLNHAPENHTGEKREGRIEEILDSPVDEKADDSDRGDVDDSSINNANINRAGSERPHGVGERPSAEKSPEPPSPKTRGRSRKNVRKWTEEETIALLRGAVKCGIGNWTAILVQPEFDFKKRSASNLKDRYEMIVETALVFCQKSNSTKLVTRFRVCCPWAYRASDPNEATKQLHDTLAKALQRAETEGSNGTTGKTILPHPQSNNTENDLNSPAEFSDVQSKNSLLGGGLMPPKLDGAQSETPATSHSPSSKAAPALSNKSKSTLASLGIPEPHITAKPRRSRRPFTNAEDEALLKGYAVHGFQWTLIQQDKRLNLNHRKATDLRDRFRTKFPHAYREGGSVSGKSLHSQNKTPTSTSDASQATDAKHNAQADGQGQEQGQQQHSSTSHNNNKSGRADRAESVPLGPTDPVLPRPAPHPQGLSERSMNGFSSASTSISFQLDEHSTATGGSSVDMSWADNTLAPMVWDELT